MGFARRRTAVAGLSSKRLRDALHTGEMSSMVFCRRTLITAAASVFVITTTCGALAAAPATTKVSVPAAMIKGSAVTGGRAFYRTALPEDSLAGIRLGRPAKEILAKWGNPSRITVGMNSVQVQDQGVPSTATGPAYIPPGGTLPSPYGPPGSSSLPGLPGPSPYGSPSEGLFNPGMPTMPGGMPGMPGTQPSTGGTTQVLSQEEVTWTYDLPNGITLEFIVTDGLITQITVGGVGPWGLSKTRTGLQLGDTYKLVLWVCGYPEKQNYAGRFLRVSYVEKNRALYTFLNNKLVGITIAMVPNELVK